MPLHSQDRPRTPLRFSPLGPMMPPSYTIRPEDARLAMGRLTCVVDVRHAVVIDAIGLCLAHAGHEPVSNTLLNDWTVVARAAFGAGDQLGKRSGLGRCVEMTQAHEDGGVLMRSLAGGMLMVVQHGLRTPQQQLRELAAAVAAELPRLVEAKPAASAPSPARDPFAGDGWWSEQLPARTLPRAETLIQDAEIVETPARA
jgi:predicted regulator of Ras-like GTPase activity (Roadblock/LC7/MglB family)